ncbi:MAG TPA: NlpC/P60 family protein [Scandinavium sp.]|jgi:cell wall-associated NlpC family hydrolase|uniref:NlpC/P60 family protein n=1 Tax=Scandinavium sp. TaxID=2830653 RepID=UPI002E337DC8|nr:NlpC/P60 family protein [Scandinavium sp.]HEX4502404.1 NlpC/P60 family protein [Scandinavium sp.]
MAWNKERAISYLNAHASSQSHHDCAAYTRRAIKAGGINLRSTNFAKDYGPILEGAGFTKIYQGETVRAGDVIVIQDSAASAAGHMAMYNGSVWVSDFRQHSDVYPGPSYRKYQPAYQIYRKY